MCLTKADETFKLALLLIDSSNKCIVMLPGLQKTKNHACVILTDVLQSAGNSLFRELVSVCWLVRAKPRVLVLMRLMERVRCIEIRGQRGGEQREGFWRILKTGYSCFYIYYLAWLKSTSGGQRINRSHFPLGAVFCINAGQGSLCCGEVF